MSDLENICDISIKESWLSGLILTNTTISRDSLRTKPIRASWKVYESGGLSGPPLLLKSNDILKKTFQLTKGRTILIGVGGISSAADAFKKISLGANLIQLYTSLIFNGPENVINILSGLRDILVKKGFKNVQSAVGCDVK